MNILTLDLATRTGFCFGVHDINRPHIGAFRVRSKGESLDDATRCLGQRLRDLFAVEKFDRVVVEDFLHPSASKGGDALVLALTLRGAVGAVAGCYGIPLVAVAAQTVRKHFCGKASAAEWRPRNAPPRSSKQKEADRAATKLMVWKRAVNLGYFDRGDVQDDDKSDAVAIFDWAVHNIARQPRPLALFGG